MDFKAVLSNAKLQIDEPEKQEGLSKEIPLGEVPVDYANSYQCAYNVRCAFCAKKTPHKVGVTAVMEDGRHALCGRDCAENLFDEEVHQKLFSDLERRQNTLIQHRLVMPVIEGAQPVIEGIRQSWMPKELALRGFLRAIRDNIVPQSFLSASGNTLQLPSDYSGKGHGSVNGMDALRMTSRPFQEAGIQLAQLSRMGTREMSDVDIREADRMRRDAMELIPQAIAAFHHAKRFFDETNLNRLGNYIVDYRATWGKCSVDNNADGSRYLVYSKRAARDDWGDELMDEFSIRLPSRDFFEHMPTEADLLEPLKA